MQQAAVNCDAQHALRSHCIPAPVPHPYTELGGLPVPGLPRPHRREVPQLHRRCQREGGHPARGHHLARAAAQCAGAGSHCLAGLGRLRCEVQQTRAAACLRVPPLHEQQPVPAHCTSPRKRCCAVQTSWLLACCSLPPAAALPPQVELYDADLLAFGVRLTHDLDRAFGLPPKVGWDPVGWDAASAVSSVCGGFGRWMPACCTGRSQDESWLFGAWLLASTLPADPQLPLRTTTCGMTTAPARRQPPLSATCRA